MGKRYTIKVYPAGMSRTVYRILQISGKETLDRLCSEIISSFDFIDEHLYEFCMDNRMYSDCSFQSDPEYGEPSTKIDLDKLHLERGQNFLSTMTLGMIGCSQSMCRKSKKRRKKPPQSYSRRKGRSNNMHHGMTGMKTMRSGSNPAKMVFEAGLRVNFLGS